MLSQFLPQYLYYIFVFLTACNFVYLFVWFSFFRCLLSICPYLSIVSLLWSACFFFRKKYNSFLLRAPIWASFYYLFLLIYGVLRNQINIVFRMRRPKKESMGVDAEQGSSIWFWLIDMINSLILALWRSPDVKRIVGEYVIF